MIARILTFNHILMRIWDLTVKIWSGSRQEIEGCNEEERESFKPLVNLKSSYLRVLIGFISEFVYVIYEIIFHIRSCMQTS